MRTSVVMHCQNKNHRVYVINGHTGTPERLVMGASDPKSSSDTIAISSIGSDVDIISYIGDIGIKYAVGDVG